jgi:hypothetical protein
VPLPPGYLDDRAAVIFLKLTLTDGNRLNAAVGTGSHTPEQIDILSLALTIKMRRNYQQVYITPGMGLPTDLRTKDDSLLNWNTSFNESL